MDLDPVVAQVIWGMGSGIAHADFLSALVFLDKNVVGGVSNAVALAEISGSIANIYLAALTATAAIEVAFNLYKMRAVA